MNRLQRLQLTVDLIIEAVDRGATSVEQIHQSIASLPFEALEKTGLLRAPRQRLKDQHDRSVGAVYTAIRRLNKQIGQLVSDQIENLEEGQQASAVLREKLLAVKAEAAAQQPARPRSRPVRDPAPRRAEPAGGRPPRGARGAARGARKPR
ncbi:MAG TPA: hypothetical protein VFV27_06450 [Nevskiaceae bacterium]|nr:hypothetical protein [Nevskiaceae bacterium]